MIKAFVKLEHLNLLSEMDLPEENFEQKDMRVEFIDLNVYGTVSFDENNCVVKVFDRNVFGESTEPVMEEDIIFEEYANAEHEQLVKIVLVFALKLNKYFRNIGILEKDGILAENEGILVESDGEEISARVVAGEERPDLLCSALFGMGEPQMARPYMDELGDSLFNEVEVPSDEEIAEVLSSNNAEAMAELATELINLTKAGDAYMFDEAFELATKSSELGSAEGTWLLALCYEHGRGVEADEDKAKDTYQKAIDMGHNKALLNLGCFYLRNDDCTEEEKKKGFELTKKSAETGYGEAMKTLGYCYQFGDGVEEDMNKAIEWFEKALEVMDDDELESHVSFLIMLQEGGAFDEDDEGDE